MQSILLRMHHKPKLQLTQGHMNKKEMDGLKRYKHTLY